MRRFHLFHLYGDHGCPRIDAAKGTAGFVCYNGPRGGEALDFPTFDQALAAAVDRVVRPVIDDRHPGRFVIPLREAWGHPMTADVWVMPSQINPARPTVTFARYNGRFTVRPSVARRPAA